MQLVFATNNKHKLREITQIVSNSYKILTLADINCYEELAETQDTIVGNAFQKARYVYQNYGVNCFADDTGLMVDAINGEPGVYSARYAGYGATFDQNIDKLLNAMKGATNREARFVTVIALIWKGVEYTFEGVVEGTITLERQGTTGFGYDPVFLPNGHDLTFAQMTAEQKNSISHRGKAVQALVTFLNSRALSE